MPTRLLHIIRTLGRALAQRTLHAYKALAQNMGVNLRGAYIGVPQQGLHGANVIAALKRLIGKVLFLTVALPSAELYRTHRYVLPRMRSNRCMH